MRFRVYFLLAVVASMMGAPWASAATIAPFVSATLPDPRNDSYPQVGFGFAANPSGTAQVNQLGYFDQGGDGLAAAHQVGLYHYNGSAYQLLATTTIPAGTGALLENGFRWMPIPTVTLTDTDQSNGWYALMATADTDTWSNNANSVVTNFGNFGFGQLAYYTANPFPSVGGTTSFGFGADIQYVGPNMGYVAAPEPSSALLMVFGVSLLGWRFRKRSV